MYLRITTLFAQALMQRISKFIRIWTSICTLTELGTLKKGSPCTYNPHARQSRSMKTLWKIHLMCNGSQKYAKDGTEELSPNLHTRGSLFHVALTLRIIPCDCF